MTATTINDTTNEQKHISPFLLFVLTLAAGISVANIYYNQPMLGTLAREFDVTISEISILSILSQVGYGVGVLFLSSLGDRFERKKLILLTMGLLGTSLLLTGIATNLVLLSLASFSVGILATVTQQIVPLAVTLSSPQKRGKVIGVMTGGILLGILLSRAVSGYVTEHYGWRTMFYAAATLTYLLAIFLTFSLPTIQSTTQIGYGKLMRSIFQLFKTQPVLRQTAFVQGLLFSAFIAFWSTIAILFEQPDYNLGASAVGLLSLVGAVGVFSAPIAGRLADKKDPARLVSISIVFVLLSFMLFGSFQGSLISLVVGVVVMDIAVQFAQVSNQSRMYAIDPSVRSRLNTVFMSIMFLGGSMGAGIGSLAYQNMGWTGICLYGGVTSLLALVISLGKRK